MNVEIKRTRRSLIKRARSISALANGKSLQVDWDRNGHNYIMTVFDIHMNVLDSHSVNGFKDTTTALHSGFDYFERYISSY